MKLIDVITERGIILNQNLDNDKPLWNLVYDLLGLCASTSIPRDEFKKKLSQMEIVQSEINPQSIYCLMKTNSVEKPGILFIRFRRDQVINDDLTFGYMVFLVTHTKSQDHILVASETLKLFQTLSIQKLLSRARDQLHAFHLIKQFAIKNVDLVEIDGGFNIYGIKED